MFSKYITDKGSMCTATTPDEWLLARYDEYQQEIRRKKHEDHDYQRQIMQIVVDHDSDLCVYPYANSNNCLYLSTPASWPNPGEANKIRADTVEFRKLLDADDRLDASA